MLAIAELLLKFQFFNHGGGKFCDIIFVKSVIYLALKALRFSLYNFIGADKSLWCGAGTRTNSAFPISDF